MRTPTKGKEEHDPVKVEDRVATVRAALDGMGALESAAFDALHEFYPGETPTPRMLKTLSYILYRAGGDKFVQWVAQTADRGIPFADVSKYLFGCLRH
jgi:hypothetical protein